MKVAIIGTRGIPNHYGGFEQFAEFLSIGLADKGYEIYVYNSHNHPYQMSSFKNVQIVHKYDPEFLFGTFGQFIYDLNCIIHLHKIKPDIVLQLGYTSSSIWGWLLPRKAKVVTNMDGLEWKRTKYSQSVKRFLRYAEKLGVKYSSHLVSDSIGIQEYILTKYNKKSTYIPYGANVVYDYTDATIEKFGLKKQEYSMLVARLEPENNIEMILDGFVSSGVGSSFIVVGNHETNYGNYLKNKYSGFCHIRFIGSIYDINQLNNLRFYSKFYFHGHTVGGTNPSLLEAMASKALVCAHDNIFNKSILNSDAFYFSDVKSVSNIFERDLSDEKRNEIIISNVLKIQTDYTWNKIIGQYETLFKNAVSDVE